MVAPPGYLPQTETDRSVRVGDLFFVDTNWYPVIDLRRVQGGGRVAILRGLQGLWRLPPVLRVMRPLPAVAARLRRP
jgi:hypothetical protein